MKKIQRDIRATKSFKTALVTLAHQEERTLSGYLSELVAEYAAGYDEARKAEAAQVQDERMRVVIDPEVWATAQKRAALEGVPLGEAMRRRAEQAMADQS